MAEDGYEAGLFAPPEGTPRADPAPDLLGNKGIKELMLAALCLFDAEHVRDTVVPVIIVAQSGGGKSTFFEGLKRAFGDDADIYPVDALTPAQAKGTTRGHGSKKEVVKATLAPLSMFDEINKWQMNYIEGVLIPVFGAEQGVRWRDGKKFDTSDWRTLPLGTLLPYWQDFEAKGSAISNKKIHDIEQILRRSLILRLDDMGTSEEFLERFVDKMASKLFSNVVYEEDGNADRNYEQLERVIGGAHSLPPPKFNTQREYREARRRFADLGRRIIFSDRVVYDRSFVANAIKLSIGMSRRYGRNVVTLDDVQRVTNILEAHAKAMGFLRIRCPECSMLLHPDIKRCPKCKTEIKTTS